MKFIVFLIVSACIAKAVPEVSVKLENVSWPILGGGKDSGSSVVSLYLVVSVVNAENYPYDGIVICNIPGRTNPITVPLVSTWPNAKSPQVSYLNLGASYVKPADYSRVKYTVKWVKPE